MTADSAKALALPLALLVAFEVWARATHLQSDSLAPPSEIVMALFGAFADLSILAATRDTLFSAFAGLAIQLSSDGYDLLSPLDWGMDDATIGRFERDTRIQLAGAGPERFAARHALLTGQHAVAWRTWRTAQVSAFYAQLASVVRGNGQRRLVPGDRVAERGAAEASARKENPQ